jgi:hypothetical protein
MNHKYDTKDINGASIRPRRGARPGNPRGGVIPKLLFSLASEETKEGDYRQGIRRIILRQ